MKRTLILIFILINVLSFAQKNKKAIKFYDLGIIAFNKKDYKTADSLFTISAELEPHVDTYFNLASSKYKLGDNCGFCKYIEEASRFGDKEASKLFYSKCFTYDTTVYKNENDINSHFSVVTSGICNKTQNQVFLVKLKDSLIYNFYFIDSAYNSIIKTFDKFPNVDSNLYCILFYMTDEMPTFMSDGKNINEFLANNIKYPQDARESGIQGTVYVSFIINESGLINNVSIMKSANAIIDKEALRVVNLMKQWSPGKYKKKPVKVSFVLPIRFRLE